ncbi:Cupin domain-containing protein [Aquimarina sp. MAR_2010_214]|uniref:cupin domain-containing protein n=1 Tax=Aquimarina sp. MAR_2010_214 TaxID=1250026 RepID=UPI000C7156C7|nr:cupin domain-containing protein [Aquimarina sp. MAR_2010_214]PKV52535.1 Cupin domain-containing protein [Aquimarina sp. MAR_2010_214]
MIDISKIEGKKIMEGFKGKFIHTEHTTLAFWEIKKGAVLPLHSHIHEQTTQVLEGKLELTIGEETNIYENGFVAVIPPNVVHSGIALTDCRVLDTFSPVREDYKNFV